MTTSHAKWASAVVAILAVCVAAAVAANGPVVRVTGGEVRGQTLPDGGAVFKGIPYAQPPVADLRWRPPAAVKPWTGVRDALQFGGECAQNPMWGHPKVVNEDCRTSTY